MFVAIPQQLPFSSTARGAQTWFSLFSPLTWPSFPRFLWIPARVATGSPVPLEAQAHIGLVSLDLLFKNGTPACIKKKRRVPPAVEVDLQNPLANRVDDGLEILRIKLQKQSYSIF